MGCITSGNRQNSSLTFHFAGIKTPKSRKSTCTLNILNKVPVITINSSLNTDATVLNLKKLIHKTYKIPSDNNILILYSNIIISNDDELTLKDFGITNNSLLFLAIKTEKDIDNNIISPITSVSTPIHIVAPRLLHRINTPLLHRINTPSPSPILTIPPIRINTFTFPNNRPTYTPFLDVFSDTDTDVDTDTDSDEDDELIHIFNHLMLPIARPMPNINVDNIPTTPLPMLLSPELPQLRLDESPVPSPSPSPEFRTLSFRQHTIRSQRIETTLPSFPTIKPALTEIKTQSNSNNLSPTNSMSQSNNLTLNTDTDIDTFSLQPVKGFDIITQEYNVLGYKMPNCAHFMNKDSLYQYAVNVFEDGNVFLHCPHSLNDGKEQKYDEWCCSQCTFRNGVELSNCEMCLTAKVDGKKRCAAKWDWSLIKKILMAHNIGHEQECIDKLTTLELLSARNKLEKECNVQKCPACETLYFRDDNDDKILGKMSNSSNLKKVFKTECVLCSDVSFCWGCGVKWEGEHFCDSSFRNELIEILKDTKTKKIGEVENVPSIRSCPGCCQLIFHSEACKHMKCKACKLDFCFVCLKPKKDGNWQCGSHSDPCAVTEKQNVKTLPDSVIINKKAFKLFQ